MSIIKIAQEPGVAVVVDFSYEGSLSQQRLEAEKMVRSLQNRGYAAMIVEIGGEESGETVSQEAHRG